jgi:NADH-quinone oxidoreductase subunit K
MIGLGHYLIVAAIMFSCGVATILLKRNAIGILIGVELILNAANVNLVAFNRYTIAATPHLEGQIFAIFVIVLAAAEAAVALAIFLNFYNNFATVDVERADNLKG